MMHELGWGVIGIGNIVQSTIAPAMVAEPECNLIASVSRDQGRADDFAAKFGAGYAYTDYEEMLANPEVEAVFIATPNGQHSEQVVAAAQAGAQGPAGSYPASALPAASARAMIALATRATA